MTKRTNKNYPNDFKQEAVSLITEQGYSVVEAAASLNITDKLLYNWVAKFKEQNENTNRLIRQYFSKETDLSPHSQPRLNEVATQLNERPRKTLKFKTPSHMIEKSVALLT